MKVEIYFIDTMHVDYQKEFVFDDDTACGISKSYTVEEFKRNIFTILRERKQSLLEETSDKEYARYGFLKILDMLAPWADSYFNEEEFEVICPDSLGGVAGKYIVQFIGYLSDNRDLDSQRICITVTFDTNDNIGGLIFKYKRPTAEELEWERARKEYLDSLWDF